VIYNTLGQKADKISIEQPTQTIHYENSKLPAGILLCCYRARMEKPLRAKELQ
jgi:hypothetical protein